MSRKEQTSNEGWSMPSNRKALWDRFVEYYREYPETGIALDISRMDFSEAALRELLPKAEQALAEMVELEKGAIANQDEGRMVGHYWLRTPELSPSPQVEKEIRTEFARVKEFAGAVHSRGIRPQREACFENLLVIGIGGSALGPQLIADALWHKDRAMQLFFCDNTDPDGISRLLDELDSRLSATLCVVISKSGGTIETRNGHLEVAHAYQARGLSFAKHAVAVTCRGSKLDLQAAKENWLASFYIWDFIGGRTSVFSAVGMLPAALQGIDIEDLLEGARAMDALTRRDNPRENPAALLALMWFVSGDGRGTKQMVVLPYKDRLLLLSKYLQQLIMESLGKAKDRDGREVNQGLVVFGNKGSTDQHAYVQQLREGLSSFFVTFVQVLQDYTRFGGHRSYLEVEPQITSGDYLLGFLLGTREALHENGRQSITLTLDALDARTLGSLIALFERTVGLYAAMINVNAYHQPGVEAGKKAAAQVIALEQRILGLLAENKGRSYSAAELAAKAGAPDDVETVYQVLQHLRANRGNRISRAEAKNPAEVKFHLA